MRKNTTLWIITKYSLILVTFYTVLDLISGEIKLSEIPWHIANLIIRLFVTVFICYILFYIAVKIFRLK
ncbi:Uncharacterised protein [Sphingobacterium thalpophilum]|uniref:Uncharacterized protein n=1 Tax=Sphingobacterium thalpophilum TaxID=259 RepID=A0A4V6KRJ8_9SPHI|nr:Uncharacterised protein [Sphingobacterium thalpophilum]